ncbi:glycine oxidase ThiO [Microvirga tunisiensis]|uniref:Glycine oxidase ThiO n=1 Tax=Microvirga tunisiensis TaxID=2108360 RepID=A0A5N7MQG5_9HYPH|nr:glycine oxidase ThiO [Microvirga tunisiensis]MPR10937.1 glycine oxidase ThiO [Microvirga tunisiensis]MPR29088.1 glycine oxidase ThiO [Microvirga tunisiensis]
MHIRVIGAGVAGLTTALELAERGAMVEVIDRGPHLGATACSWYAGGMLAPWCERESADPAVTELGYRAIDWWLRRFPGTTRKGTLVVAQPRDVGDLTHFARRTDHFDWVDSDRIADLEPDLQGRFHKGLFFVDEAHLDPRSALTALAARLLELGVSMRFGAEAPTGDSDVDRIIDCRGFAAQGDLPDLRGVKGEMLLVRTREIFLQRPVRLLHPRIPLYIVPRENGLFMIGATMIESSDRGRVTARSTVELLNGAYSVHPAFGEAEIIEFGADVRPTFPDNLPAIRESGRTIYFNGLYRHGLLLAPAFAIRVADAVFRN